MTVCSKSDILDYLGRIQGKDKYELCLSNIDSILHHYESFFVHTSSEWFAEIHIKNYIENVMNDTYKVYQRYWNHINLKHISEHNVLSNTMWYILNKNKEIIGFIF